MKDEGRIGVMGEAVTRTPILRRPRQKVGPMSRARETLLAFFTTLLYVIAFLFFVMGLFALTESAVAGLLCFVVGLLICLLISLAEIRRTLQRREDQR